MRSPCFEPRSNRGCERSRSSRRSRGSWVQGSVEPGDTTACSCASRLNRPLRAGPRTDSQVPLAGHDDGTGSRTCWESSWQSSPPFLSGLPDGDVVRYPQRHVPAGGADPDDARDTNPTAVWCKWLCIIRRRHGPRRTGSRAALNERRWFRYDGQNPFHERRPRRLLTITAGRLPRHSAIASLFST